MNKIPKRIIIYQLDGVSAMFNKSYNLNSGMPKTYLDEIYKKSYVKKYTYGLDGTCSFLYKIMSGKSHIEAPESRVDDYRKFNINRWITDMFKAKGYRTHYYTNYKWKTNKLALKFDRKEQHKCVYDFSKTKLDNDFWGIGTKEKTFLFIHDLFTHDRKGEDYDHPITTKEYKEHIVDNCELLRKNLKHIKFNSKEDLLVIMSDHGLVLDSTVVPKKQTILEHLKVMFKKERLSNWDLSAKETKSRVMFMMTGCGIKHKVDENVCSIQSAFNYLLEQLDLYGYLSDKALYYNLGYQAIIPICGMFPINPFYLIQKVIFNDRFYQFVFINGSSKKRTKYVYQKNLGKCIVYFLEDDINETNPIKIKFKDLPLVFQKYIKEYNSTRRKDIKFFIEKIKKGALSPL